jgi:tetratricopeptide (TPR) repeat protein
MYHNTEFKERPTVQEAMMQTQKTVAERFAQAMSEFINNNFTDSIALFSDVLNQDAHHSLALIARGSAFMKQGNFDNAIEDFDRAIRIRSDYARAYHMRGVARYEKGDNQGALQDFDKAIDLDPEYAAAYYSRANVHSLSGDDEAAAEDAAMAMQLGVRNLEVYSGENNMVRTQHMAVEDMLETELDR